MDHYDFVMQLGESPKEIAAWLEAEAGMSLTRDALYKWRHIGVPWRWRPYVARLAVAKSVPIPEDFLAGLAA